MASPSRTVRVKFDGDAKGLGQAAKAGEQALSKFQKATGKMGDFGKTAADMLGKGLKMGAIGIAAVALGIGAAVVGGIGQALEQGAIKAKLAAQLGASGPDAARLGKLAGKLYVDGYGESMGDTADMIKASFNQGLVSLKDTDAKIQDVVGSVSTYTTLTGTDAVAATGAVAQMIKTGLAKDGKEAFDLLTVATQKGIDKSGDLLDTVNEYGTQFRKLGLDGKTSLGLINQMLQGGARDADTAADAVKEFAIRAVDGSKTTVDAYKSLHLNAKQMAEAIASGGPAAKAAFGDILDGLNGIKDPVERNRVGVELFGTKWEDLGAAIGKADLDTAAASMGNTAGAIDKANAAISNTPLAKLEKVKKQITQTFIDALGKYAVPILEKFADWFNGPGKFAIVDWALAASTAVLDFADKFLASLQDILGFVGKWGEALLKSMAVAIAPFNAGLAKSFWDAGDDVAGFATRTNKQLADARAGIKTTQTAIERARLVTKLTANKEDLDTKLKNAKEALKDPKLTATKRAKLTADIAELTARRNEAQRQINALTGKTVKVTINTYKNLIETTIPGGSGVRLDGKKAAGGPVLAGRRYLVGEKGPEVLTMGASSGNITPNHELGGGGGDTIVYITIDGQQLQGRIDKTLKQQNKDLKRTVKAGVN